jgi:hypothetical protein
VNDPYDYIASRIDPEIHPRITEFWKDFEQHADAIAKILSTPNAEPQDIAAIMRSLQSVSRDLLWEFGPSDRGHSLAITAEFGAELRPLARLVVKMAPDLSRWRFSNEREAIDPSSLSSLYQARFQQELTLESIEGAINQNGRIDLFGRGVGNSNHLTAQTLGVSTLLLGEAKDRDWLGYVDATSKGGGLFGFFSRDANPFDAAGFVGMFDDLIAQAESRMLPVPYSDVDWETQKVMLASNFQMPVDHPRNDLITFQIIQEQYLNAVTTGTLFSSRCHSKFDEWFMYLRISRTNKMPFDDVNDRGNIEEQLHSILSKDGLGGVVGAGHGTENVYIDFATINVERAVGRIQTAFRDKAFSKDATLNFMDQGLQLSGLAVVPKTANKD